ncbi:hypothetical protein HK102_011648, partial [Quaeritorhiza haematococci]
MSTTWARYDPTGTGYIKAADLIPFMRKLAPQLPDKTGIDQGGLQQGGGGGGRADIKSAAVAKVFRDVTVNKHQKVAYTAVVSSLLLSFFNQQIPYQSNGRLRKYMRKFMSSARWARSEVGGNLNLRVKGKKGMGPRGEKMEGVGSPMPSVAHVHITAAGSANDARGPSEHGKDGPSKFHATAPTQNTTNKLAATGRSGSNSTLVPPRAAAERKHQRQGSWVFQIRTRPLTAMSSPANTPPPFETLEEILDIDQEVLRKVSTITHVITIQRFFKAYMARKKFRM